MCAQACWPQPRAQQTNWTERATGDCTYSDAPGLGDDDAAADDDADCDAVVGDDYGDVERDDDDDGDGRLATRVTRTLWRLRRHPLADEPSRSR